MALGRSDSVERYFFEYNKRVCAFAYTLSCIYVAIQKTKTALVKRAVFLFTENFAIRQTR